VDKWKSWVQVYLGAWEVPKHFERHMRCLSASKNALSTCRWKSCRVLFLLVWHISSVVVRFIAGELFFPPFFSLSFIKKYSLALLVVGILTSVFILLISDFWSCSFCKNFICFQFYPSIPIYQILYFSNWFSFFWLLFFFLTFCKNFISFQFHHSIQIDGIMFFNLILIILISNFLIGPFVKAIILFNSTL